MGSGVLTLILMIRIVTCGLVTTLDNPIVEDHWLQHADEILLYCSEATEEEKPHCKEFEQTLNLLGYDLITEEEEE